MFTTTWLGEGGDAPLTMTMWEQGQGHPMFPAGPGDPVPHPFDQPAAPPAPSREGWVCPLCRRVYSPDTGSCAACDPYPQRCLGGATSDQARA